MISYEDLHDTFKEIKINDVILKNKKEKDDINEEP